LSLTATSGTAWSLPPASIAATDLTTTGSATTDITSAASIRLTNAAAKEFRLVDAPTITNTTVTNVGAGLAKIHKSATKKLFTSTGYVDFVPLEQGRAASFSYSANLNAWIKV
jgi:hypothetical protein